ncbi:MAG: hypothetical protein ACKO5K_00075 [Armatimonadota bacterium]
MYEAGGGFPKWFWGLIVPIGLVVLSLVWLGMGEVTLTGRAGGTTYRGWGLVSCTSVPFSFGLRLHAELFLATVPSVQRTAQWIAAIAGWMLALGLAGCVAWVVAEARP